MRKLIISLCLLLTLVSAGTLTDEAYRAYRAKDYKKAFELYKKGYEEGNIKAIYNLAVMYEKGLGTGKNPEEADVLYGLVVMALEDTDKLNDPAICKSEMLPYYYKAFRKLAKHEEERDYMKKYRRLKRLCSSAHTDPYLRKCPAAKIVKKEDRYNLKNFECRFYQRYPQAMRKLLSLHSRYREAQVRFRPKSAEIGKEIARKEKTLQQQMKAVASPIIKAYTKVAEACIGKAETKGDLKQCEWQFAGHLSDLLEPGPKPVTESEWFFASPEKKKRIEKENREKATAADKQKYLEKIRRYL